MLDSLSPQRRHVLSSTGLLFAKLSRVKSLFLDKSHRNNWTLGGILSFHIALTNTGEIPLKLTTYNILLKNYMTISFDPFLFKEGDIAYHIHQFPPKVHTLFRYCPSKSKHQIFIILYLTHSFSLLLINDIQGANIK